MLNTAPADQLGNVLPVRECNIKGDPARGAPVFGLGSAPRRSRGAGSALAGLALLALDGDLAP